MKVKRETVGRVVGGTAGGVVLGHVGTGIGTAALVGQPSWIEGYISSPTSEPPCPYTTNCGAYNSQDKAVGLLGGAIAATWPLAVVGVIGGAVIGSSVGKRTKGADSETGPEHGRDPKD